MLRDNMSYKYLEDISLADVAFEATGKNLEELFESAALATTNVMIKDLNTIKHKIKRKIKLKSSTIENLLHDFLQEIVFLKDAKQLIFNKYKIKINEKKVELNAEISGEKLNSKTQEHMVDVKAVTWHHFTVKKLDKKWEATVILDI